MLEDEVVVGVVVDDAETLDIGYRGDHDVYRRDSVVPGLDQLRLACRSPLLGLVREFKIPEPIEDSANPLEVLRVTGRVLSLKAKRQTGDELSVREIVGESMRY